jgi:hypothetical protein
MFAVTVYGKEQTIESASDYIFPNQQDASNALLAYIKAHPPLDEYQPPSQVFPR